VCRTAYPVVVARRPVELGLHARVERLAVLARERDKHLEGERGRRGRKCLERADDEERQWETIWN
jgi:hypothetical protein